MDARGVDLPVTRPPVWLLDVDGVLNAVTRSPDRGVWPDWRRGHAEADGVAWSVCFSPSATRGIRLLHDSGLVEVRWLTTWRSHANAGLRRLLDLPELAVVPDGSAPAGSGQSTEAGPVAPASGMASHGAATAVRADSEAEWWKLTAVRRLVAQEPGRALVWTDDELADRPEAVAWVRSSVARSLLIAPSPHVGLTPGHLGTIEEFARLQSGSTDPWSTDP